MLNLSRFKRRVNYYFTSTKDVKFHDKVPKGFLTIDQIPDKVFDNDIMLVNWGISERFKVHVVTATQLNFEVPYGEM